MSLNNKKQISAASWLTNKYIAKPDSIIPQTTEADVAHQPSSHNLINQPMINFFGRKSKSSAIIMAISALIALIIIYFFVSPYLVRVRIGQVNLVGSRSYSQYQKILNKEASAYRLKVVYSENKIKKYSLSAVGLSVNYPETIKNLNSVSFNLVNRLQPWKQNNLDIAFTSNTKVIANFNKLYLTQVILPPVNANIALSGGQVVLSNSSVGKEYGVSGGIDSVIQSAKKLSPNPIKLKVIAINPPITTQQLSAQEPVLTSILSQRVVLSIAGSSVVASADQVGSWINVKVSTKTGKLVIVVDSTGIKNYIDSVAQRYTRPSKDQLVLVGSDGTNTVIQSGQNGISVTDESRAIKTISDEILSGKGVNATISVSTSPFGTVTTQTYPKWIEVNVTTKRMYVYENANLVNTFLVSAGKPSTPTPIGVFKIFSKYAVQTMVGADYVQPNVPWINYFKSGGYAIHGNYWRPPDWFGNINSSHGCVGLQVSDAEWVYNWAPIGTPIVIHG